ncbi:hypothetical protein STEG23_020414 [Scotinomys teguina]
MQIAYLNEPVWMKIALDAEWTPGMLLHRGEGMVLSLHRMADNIGSQPDGSRHGQLRTAPYPRGSPRAPDDEGVPTDAMAHLCLGGRCRRRQLTTVPLPTWRQVKKLTGEGQKMLQRTGKALTVENLFLAVCALLTVNVLFILFFPIWLFLIFDFVHTFSLVKILLIPLSSPSSSSPLLSSLYYMYSDLHN